MFDNMHKCVDGTILGHDLAGIFQDVFGYMWIIVNFVKML